MVTLGERRVLGQRAGGDDAHDRAVDDARRVPRILHLVADHDLLAHADQPVDVGLGAARRHAGHRHGFFALVARREREPEEPRCLLGVLEEELEEVSHPEEEEAVRMLLPGRPVLLHDRGVRTAGFSRHLLASFAHAG